MFKRGARVAAGRRGAMAKGYVIVNANVTDPEKYAEYRPLAVAEIEAFDGRYLARSGKSKSKTRKTLEACCSRAVP